jgi:light-independent protochlorophyllide reductase subunit B
MMTGRWEKNFPIELDIAPMGVVETTRCIPEDSGSLNAQGADVDYEAFVRLNDWVCIRELLGSQRLDRLQRATGKKAVVFSDNTAGDDEDFVSRDGNPRCVRQGTYCRACDLEFRKVKGCVMKCW